MSEEMIERIDDIDVNRETALVEYEKHLSEDEIIEKAKLLADLHTEIKNIQADKDVVMADFNSRIKTRTAQISTGLGIIKNGFETVEEECTFEFLWNEGIVEYYSCETGDMVKKREITNEERQMKLFDERKKKDDELKKHPGNSGSNEETDPSILRRTSCLEK